jgi:hypothetical protein
MLVLIVIRNFHVVDNWFLQWAFPITFRMAISYFAELVWLLKFRLYRSLGYFSQSYLFPILLLLRHFLFYLLYSHRGYSYESIH